MRRATALVILAAAVFAWLAFAPGSDAAAKIRVPGDYPTIQQAVDAAPDGATIEIAAGNYTGLVAIHGRTGLVLKGKTGAVFDGQGGQGFSLKDSSGITLSGLTLRNVANAVVWIEDSSDIVLSKCRIEDALFDGIHAEDCAGIRVTGCAVLNCANGGFIETGSTGVIIVKSEFRMIGDKAINLSEYGGPGPSGSSIVGNEISEVTNHGIYVGGRNTTIAKNLLENIALAGINCDTSGNSTGTRVLKNTVRNTGGQGIILGGPESRAEKNTISDTGGTAIELRGESQTATGNRIAYSSAIGIHASGVGPHRAEKNAILGGIDGIRMDTSDGAILRNNVSGAGQYGIHVYGTGNRIDRNTALGSGQADLRDHNAEGVNSYDRNRFGTEHRGGK